MKSLLRAVRAPLAGLLLSFLVCGLLILSFGENPSVLGEALSTTLFTQFGLGYVIFYSTPLIFTGLSVAIAFHCGLFNIGAEGQLYLGSISILATSSLFPNLPAPIAIPLAMVFCALSGGIWGGIAGFLKARRGSHEVIVTILLNFIGIMATNYLILYVFKDPSVQGPETITIPNQYRIPLLSDLFEGWLANTPANSSFFMAIVVALLCYLFLFKTTYGYELRAVGQNPAASQIAGISVPRNTFLALFLSGAIAGLVGVNEVMGYAHKLTEGFSPQYGFTGIAVALLARNHPIGIILSALLFGAITNSARELEFSSDKVTKEISLVLQATLIAFVACDYLIDKFLHRKRRATN